MTGIASRLGTVYNDDRAPLASEPSMIPPTDRELDFWINYLDTRRTLFGGMAHPHGDRKSTSVMCQHGLSEPWPRKINEAAIRTRLL